MSNQGTIRLKVTNDAPSVDKLWNNRYRLEFLCDNNSPKEDWYYDNIASILPDYGVLQDADFGSGVSEGWEAIPGSVYPDMRLTGTQYTYISSIGDKRVILTYETLTSAWVEEKAEDTDYELNGLKRVSRTFVALPGTAYDKVVGTSTINSDGTTLYLGSFKIEKTEAKWELSETWFEAGIVSRASIDSADGSEVQQITTYLAVEGTAVGPVTRREVRSIEGLPTYTITETLSPDGTSIISEDPKLVSQNSSMQSFPVPGLIRLKENERKITRYDNLAIPPKEYESDSINYSFELFGPVDSISKHVTYEFMQTEPEIQEGDYTYNGARGLWSPPSWARSTISGIDINGKPFSVSKAYRGYRAPSNLLSFSKGVNSVYYGSGTSVRQVTQLVSVDGDVISSLFIDGYQMSGEVSPIIEIGGGPEDPVGNTYVTDVRIVPDFTDDDGVQYYKKYITTAYVNAERIDEARSNDIANNRFSSYTFTSEPSGNLSITLDETLLASDDDFYIGASIEIYPRDKDAANKFQTLQKFRVYDYDSINNKLLLKPEDGYVVPSQLVGLYDGTGNVSANESYDFARLSITKYATTGTITKVRGAYVWIDSANDTAPKAYAGWTFKITSGAFDGDTYTIAVSYSGRVGLTTIPTDIPEAGTTFELIPPQSF
jgi:hypothetical protein